jgi:hypothetical protein
MSTWDTIKNGVAAVAATFSDDDIIRAATITKRDNTSLEPRKKKADLRSSPGKEGQESGRLVNMTPVNLNKQSLERSVGDSAASSKSSLARKNTEDLMKKRDQFRQMAIQRRMKLPTDDMHVHAVAMLIGFNIDFDLIQLSVKTQILSDVQAIISSPAFDCSPLYHKFNLDIVINLLTIKEKTHGLNKKDLIVLSKIIVQGVINKYLQPVEDISSKT